MTSQTSLDPRCRDDGQWFTAIGPNPTEETLNTTCGHKDIWQILELNHKSNHLQGPMKMHVTCYWYRAEIWLKQGINWINHKMWGNAWKCLKVRASIVHMVVCHVCLWCSWCDCQGAVDLKWTSGRSGQFGPLFCWKKYRIAKSLFWSPKDFWVSPSQPKDSYPRRTCHVLVAMA